MKLNELLDTELLIQHAHNHLVGCQRHPTLPLRIYNYTHVAQHEPHWGDGTIDYCRGLIVDDDNNIIARPFKKFHNLNTTGMPETMFENLPNTIPTITKKMDGSLGIWYPDDSPEGAIATRGSFTSEQALWATDYWKGRCASMPQPWKGMWTPLFEIIYPQNRIVVDYKGWYGLVTIGGVDIETGKDIPHGKILYTFGRFVVNRVDGSLKELEALNTPNEEGFVASYNDGDLRVKIKFEEYKRLHRIVTGMNPHTVWESLRDHKDLPKQEGLPANFQKWLNSWTDHFMCEFIKIQHTAVKVYLDRPIDDGHSPRLHRAACARYFQASANERIQGVLFAMLDGKNPDPYIWKLLEPRGDDKSFLKEGE